STPANLDRDEVLLATRPRSRWRWYRRSDADRQFHAMRRRIVTLRAELSRANASQARAEAIVTAARLQSAEILADANILANRQLDAAHAESHRRLAETQKACQAAASHGIRAAFEMAASLGYKDTRATRHEEATEQDAFERFFSSEIEDDPARKWMVAS
ncbi:MAG: hypothetical protein OEU32_19605, partial [Acidimicrobiia bacterium]|nr:hypothetical protein [Acidimicrobiia bacterium]